MPRKPKPPIYDLYVQGLSTGEQPEQAEHVEYDDFNGKPIKVIAPSVKPKRTARVIEDYALRSKALRIEAEAKAKALTERRHAIALKSLIGKPIQSEPKLAYNQMLTQSGHVITLPRNPNAIKRRM